MRFTTATADAAPQVCIIAEIGVNHDGQLDRAIKLVHAAAEAGADAVKFQLFDADALLSNQAVLAEYQKGDAAPAQDRAAEDDARQRVLAMLSRLQLTVDDLRAVRTAARDAGVAFVLTPFSLEVIDTLASLDVDAVKIASPDAVNHPLLRAAASVGKPMIVSTGTADIDELAFAADLLHGHAPGAPGNCLLQCVSSYPTPIEHAALGGIRALAERFGLPVGYSDHTTDVWCGALAVAAGACVLEKHITYDRKAAGPDHAASLEPDDFARYVRFARRAAAMLGPIAKRCLPIERDVRDVSRQSVCVTRDLPAGHVLTRDDVTVKRPGTGVPAAELENVLGRGLKRAVRANQLLTESDVQSR
jgi:N-acetylneuraminate synthase/N,N'-diacetyllegionaminate synthase